MNVRKKPPRKDLKVLASSCNSPTPLAPHLSCYFDYKFEFSTLVVVREEFP